MSHSVFICAIREIRGQTFFHNLPWVAGEARAGKLLASAWAERYGASPRRVCQSFCVDHEPRLFNVIVTWTIQIEAVLLMNIIRSFASRLGRRMDRRAAAPGFDRLQAAEVLETRQYLSADFVIQWNDILLDAIRTDRTAPPIAARDMAIMHTAVFDAVNSIDRQYAPYATMVVVHPRASKEAAAVAAAYQTLISMFPAQKAKFDTQYLAAFTAIPDGQAETDGENAGKAVASRILALRATDGSSAIVTYTPGTDPGDWRPTPPAFQAAVLPQWPAVQPWVMTSGSQFRPIAPPPLNSVAYATALNEVKSIGSATSSTRTNDQTDIAKFWANGAGTSTPPGHWNQVAQIVATDRHNSLEENARLFAMLNIGLADAAIACWDAKYEYNFWRPVTAIRFADTDNSAATIADQTWTSLLVTPAFSAYTSGHSTFSGTAAAILKGFFGRDQIHFVLPSETAGVSSRTFNSFSQAAAESGVSRIYGGIHYSFDNVAGLEAGAKLGRYVDNNFLKKDAGTATATLVNGELYVNGTSRADNIRIVNRSGGLVVTSGSRVLGRFTQSLVTHITVDAGAGNDVVTLVNVDISSDIYGGRGNDILIGGNAADRIWGEDGWDSLFGGSGDDTLDGGLGRNALFGGSGTDTLKGIRHLDLLFGGSVLDEILWSSRT